MPYCLVSLGPSGVGKTSTLEYQIENLGLSPEYIKLNIDNCVVSNPDYIDFVEDLVESDPDILDHLRRTDVIQAFEKKYFEIRSKVCDDLFQEEFGNFLSEKENIVMEFTGITDLHWIFEKYGEKLKDYDIIFHWTVSGLCEIISRSIDRSQKEMLDFIEGRSFPPRVSYKSKPDLIRNLQEIIKNLSKNVRVIVVNNAKNRKPEVIYDNINNFTVKRDLTEIFDLAASCLIE